MANASNQSISLDHVAFAVENWSQAGALLAERFGGIWLHGLEQPAFNPCQLAYANGMRVELMEVGSQSNSFIRKFLLETGVRARPHHVTFKVPDIKESIEKAISLGFEPILVNIEFESWKEAFLHPKETGLGFLVQIVQAVGEIKDSVPESMLISAPWKEPLNAPASLPVFVSMVADIKATDIVLRDFLDARVTSYSDSIYASSGMSACIYSWDTGADLMVIEQQEREFEEGIGLLAFRSDATLSWNPNEIIQALKSADLDDVLGVRIVDLATEG
jgi:methylmalonyl-CoA/ethylmalonyl-CoA epimerase